MATPLLIVTGFGPFGDVQHNPSGELALALDADPPSGMRVAATVLPVTFDGVPGALERHVKQAGPPAALLSMGVHPGAGFRLERRARARPTSQVVDNLGRVGGDHGADRERVSTLDLDQLQTWLTPFAEASSTSVVVSDDAGGYVCDWTYQHLLQHAEHFGVPGLFLHVPPLELLPMSQQLAFVREVAASLLQAGR